MSTKSKDAHGEHRIEGRPAAVTTPPPAPAGRIVHDSRGNAVWNSAANTLDISELRIEDDAPAEQQAATQKRGASYGVGYNPYDRAAPPRGAPPKK